MDLLACGASVQPSQERHCPCVSQKLQPTKAVHLLAAGLSLEEWPERERALQGQVEQLGQRLARAEAAASQVQVNHDTTQADLADGLGAAHCHDPVRG